MILRMTFAALYILVSTASPVLAQATPQPDPVQACRQFIPEGQASLLELDPPVIEIVAPENNAVVQGDQIAITIDWQNFVLDGEKHWHVWVDGQLLGMIYEPATLLDLQPGTHQICAALADSLHGTVGKATGIQIVVEALAPGASTPTIPAVVGEIVNEPLFDVTQIILLIGGGLLAVLAGWWAGQKLARRPVDNTQKR